MPILVGDCHVWYDLLDVFVRSFDITVHLWPVGRRIVTLNLELLAQYGDHSVVEICTIVSDDTFGDTVPTNEVLLDEAGNHILCDGCEGSCFDPFGKVVNGHQNETVSIRCCRLDLSNHVDFPQRECPRSC